MNLYMHTRGCEKMKFEFEIKEENWETLDSNPKVQILITSKLNSDYQIKTLVDVIKKKFPVEVIDYYTLETTDKNGYFYGFGYIPIFEKIYVRKFIFRTKDLSEYKLITLYSHTINKALEGNDITQ